MADAVSAERVQVRGPATAPAVLLLHPWWGVTPAVMWWADQLSGAGRRVVVPDLFAGRTYETVEAAEAFSDVMDDRAAIAMIERCADELAAEGVPWAVMGFSMGAYFACPLATRGASAPAELVQELIDRLGTLDKVELETLPGITENVRFRMPAELVDSTS